MGEDRQGNKRNLSAIQNLFIVWNLDVREITRYHSECFGLICRVQELKAVGCFLLSTRDYLNRASKDGL